MPELIVDPTNANVALIDGKVGFAIRAGRVADPARPTRAELEAMPIIGYADEPPQITFT